jgi:hypothetical protein
LAELLAGEGDVAADADSIRLEESDVGLADTLGEVLVELGGDSTADVVGFEGCEWGHRREYAAVGADSRHERFI